MKKLELADVKQIELDILIYLDQVCKKHNLRYFLCGGTMLGAVRHKGFIPWDDDIDILMPRPDYKQLIEILKKEHGRYTVCDTKDEGYYYNFAKVVDSKTKLVENGHNLIANMGVYVDIFPLDGMPSDPKEREEHFKQLDKLRKRINTFSFTKPKLCKNIFFYIKKYAIYIKNKYSDLGNVQQAYEQLAEQYAYDESEFLYATGGAYGAKEIFKKEIFAKSVQLEFEGHFFPAPAAFDTYLKQLYNDYLQLPPVEKRVTHHNFDAWYK